MRWRRTKSQAELSLDGFNKLRSEGRLAAADEVGEEASSEPSRTEAVPAEREQRKANPWAREIEPPRAVPRPKKAEAPAPPAPEPAAEPEPVAETPASPRERQRRRRARAVPDMPPHLLHHLESGDARRNRPSAEERRRLSADVRERLAARPPLFPHADESSRTVTSVPEIDAHQHLRDVSFAVSDTEVRLHLPDIESSETVELMLPQIEDLDVPVLDAVDDLTGEISLALRRRKLDVHSPLVRKTLLNNGIETFGDLVGYTREQLLAIKGIGAATLTLLENMLKKHGLGLRAEGEEQDAPDGGTATLFDRAPRSELDKAEEQVRGGELEAGLARLLRGIESRLLSFARSQGATRGAASPIMVARKLLAERRIAKSAYDHLMEAIRICSRATTGHEVSADQAQVAFSRARAGLGGLTLETAHAS